MSKSIAMSFTQREIEVACERHSGATAKTVEKLTKDPQLQKLILKRVQAAHRVMDAGKIAFDGSAPLLKRLVSRIKFDCHIGNFVRFERQERNLPVVCTTRADSGDRAAAYSAVLAKHRQQKS